jgi:hypothetical protein
LALVAGVAVGNYLHQPLDWWFDSDRSPDGRELLIVLCQALEPKPADANPTDAEGGANPLVAPPARFWLPLLGLLATLVELLIPPSLFPAIVVGGARMLIAVLVGRVMTPPDFRASMPWLPWALGLAIFIEWTVLSGLARQWKNGMVPALTGLCFAAAGAVMLLAHYKKPMDVALFFFASLFAIAIVASIFASDTGPALAASAVVLPGLVLETYYYTSDFGDVPLLSFLLAALAPIALAPMLLPYWARREGWARWAAGAVLPLVPAAAALLLAAQADKAEF